MEASAHDAPDATGGAGSAPAPVPAPERHAGWNELFFDLIAVAGVGQLAHLLHSGPTWGDLALYGVLYAAFWITWAGFVVYGDVAAGTARTSVLLGAMSGMAVMAAAVHSIGSGGTDTVQAVSFVLAYAALRWLAGRVWQRGSVVTDWPLAQIGTGAAPWLASLFVDDPWRYRLWALGIALDLFALFAFSRERALRQAQDRRVREDARPQHGRRQHVPEGRPRLHEAHTDAAHLAERLGLYVIIVLGEGVIQVIDAAADLEDWTPRLAATGVAALALLASLWTLSLLYGSNGVPHLRSRVLSPRLVMLLHAVSTAALAALAAGLGIAVAHADSVLPAPARWLVCAALTLYFTLGLLAALPARPRPAWIAAWALPCILVPLAVAAFGARLPTWGVVLALFATVAWQILYHSGPPGTTDAEDPA
ncbi:low temperature requirement protein A [Streptomyces sp. NPDC001941]|uniref:low temperature requirement protein A n=1 Tax=Streptomyces sp. NPDC001941 TaxID=3154659 RepID=UPI003329506E